MTIRQKSLAYDLAIGVRDQRIYLQLFFFVGDTERLQLALSEVQSRFELLDSWLSVKNQQENIC